MQDVINSFDARVQEIDLYFRMLETLEEPNLQLCYPDRAPRHRYKTLDPEWLKTLKATAFLLIYNVVESSIRDGIGAIYEKAVADGCTVELLDQRIRNIWINQQYRAIDGGGSSVSFRNKGHDLVRIVLDRSIVELKKELVPMSGNLDARKIRELCDKHGLSFSNQRVAHMGDRLVTVKDKRNSLAHGEESFSECGRQHTVAELIEIKKQAIRFLRSVLRNIDRYIQAERYKA